MSRRASDIDQRPVTSWSKWVSGKRLTAREYRAVKRWIGRFERAVRRYEKRQR